MKGFHAFLIALVVGLAVGFSSTASSYDGKAGTISGNSYIDFIVVTVSKKYGVDHLLIHAIIRQESAYNVFAVSHKGAQGLMQLMPATQRYLGVKNPYDPWQNIDGGVRYILEQLLKFGSVNKALGAYNAGPQREASARRPRETVTYIAKVNKEFRRLKLNQS